MAAPAPLVGIVVPCWNREQETLRCLAALGALDYPRYRIIVVDNGSSAASLARLERAAGDVVLIRHPDNRGFSAAANAGARAALAAGADYVWLLNNDAVAHRGALSALVALAESDPTIGAAGSVLQEGPAWIGGARLNLWSGIVHHVGIDDGAPVDYLIGASLLLRARTLRATGLLDEGYFLYWEDAELSFRMRAAGWRLAVATDSTVEHRGTRPLAFAEPMRDFHYTRSSIRFLRAHARIPWLAALVLTAGRVASRVRHRRWANIGAIVRALRDGDRRETSP